MYIEKFLIHDFAPEDGSKPEYAKIIDVPLGSRFLATEILPDGIWAFYEVPSLATGDRERVQFELYNQASNETPANLYWISVHTLFVEGGAIIFHVYKSRE